MKGIRVQAFVKRVNRKRDRCFEALELEGCTLAHGTTALCWVDG